MFKIHRSDKNESVKKSIQKILDPKKDVVTRLKHLKLILGKLIVVLYVLIILYEYCFVIIRIKLIFTLEFYYFIFVHV